MNLRKIAFVLLLALPMLFLVACGREVVEEPVLEPVETPTITYEPEEEIEPEPEPWTGPRNPLTYLPVEEDISQNRPFAMVINNLQQALPQHGLRYADMIYEVPVEGGITRLLAIFQDLEGVGEIGPIRSAREYMLDISQGHDALFVHAGGSPGAYNAIRGRGIPNIDGVMGTGREFQRDAERSRRFGQEHALFTTEELILNNIDSFHFRREHNDDFSTGLQFAENAIPENGVEAQHVSVFFSNHKTGIFVFDEEQGTYAVSQYGNPHIDGITGEQLQVTNVLVLFASFRSIDNEGRLAVDFSTGGRGYYITGGVKVPILWEKPAHTAAFTYTLEDGTALVLNMGRTWVNIVNSNTGNVTLG